MTLRPAPASARLVALDYEIAQDQASALGRLGRALEAALAALTEHDRAAAHDAVHDAGGHAPGDGGAADRVDNNAPAENRAARARLVQQASHALWCYMVQRESCGLRDPRPVIRDYRIPVEVQNRMGMMPAPPSRRRSAP